MNVDRIHRRLGTSNKDVWPTLAKPEFSVILSSHNNAKQLDYVLNSWTTDQGLRFEVIIADDGSNDSSLDICRKQWPFECRYVWKPNRGFHMSHAINLGVKIAQSSSIFVSDTGCLAFPGLLAEHAKLLKRHVFVGGNCIQCDDVAIYGYAPEEMSIYGVLKSLTTTACVRRDLREFNHVPMRETTLNGDVDFGMLSIGASTNVSFMRPDWYELGGYDERYVQYGLQDYEFVYRFLKMGWSSVFNPLAVNINIGVGERKLIHPDNAALFTELTGWPIDKAVIDATNPDLG